MQTTTFTLLNPTKKRVIIRGAAMPFYLAMSEAYHDQWQLELDNANVQGRWNSWLPFEFLKKTRGVVPDAVPAEQHFKLNNFLNGWYVAPSELCAKGETEIDQAVSDAREKRTQINLKNDKRGWKFKDLRR